MTARGDASYFLQQVEIAIDCKQCQFVPRGRTDQDLARLNITRAQAFEVIKGLSPDHYVKGPEPDDHDASKEIWVFGCEVNDTEVYIKLRLITVGGRGMPRAAVYSFHEADFEMKYPLRGSGR